MKIIMTGPNDILAYWNDARAVQHHGIFGHAGRLRLQTESSFARLSAFADNSNHPPSEREGAVTSDDGMNLLFRIAGAR